MKCLIKEVVENNTPCIKAKRRLNKKGVRGEKLDDQICPWHIDSNKYLNCFWLYILDSSNSKQHQLTEIAKLFKTSINNIKLIEVGAFVKLKEKLNHLKNQ